MNRRISLALLIAWALLPAAATLLAASPASHASATPSAAHGGSAATTAPHVTLPYAHPTLPAAALWPGVMVLLVLGLFAAAAAVGVAVRLNAPDEVPSAHSHDEPPGTSGHHGPGGTAHPGPERDLPGGHHAPH